MGIIQNAINQMIGTVGLAARLSNEIRMKQANSKAAQKSETKQKTRRNFMDYLKNINIQGGGKVGDLPQNIQKKIAAQYSKEKRKSIMDSVDKEKNKNGK